MIFVTVGSQMAFDRLIVAVDAWAGRNPDRDVMAQMGNTSLRPRNMRCFPTLTPQEFSRTVEGCQLIVGHAGMGTVLTALEHLKPMILMPRRGDLHETRNDHQIATLNWLRGKTGIHAAFDEEELFTCLDKWAAEGLSAPSRENSPGQRKLQAALQDFIGQA